MDHEAKRDKWVKLDVLVILDRKAILEAKAKKVRLEKRDPEAKEDRLGLMVSLVGLDLTTGTYAESGLSELKRRMFEFLETVIRHFDIRSDNEQTLNFDFGLFLFDE